MNEDKITDLLKDEYLQIQHHIETIDERVISIKNWSVSVSMAGIATAFVSHNATILLLSCVSSLIFLSVEGLWKTFQSAFFPRADEIEKYFRNEIQEIKPMQIGISANLAWKANPIKK